MRVVQLITPGATWFDRKHQRVDAVVLGEVGQVETFASGEPLSAERRAFREIAARADLVHVYGRDLPLALLRLLSIPYVSEGAPPRSRLPFRRAPEPAAAVEHVGRGALPEAVESLYFSTAREPRTTGSLKRVGSIRTSPAAVIRELTLARIHRFRDDIEWTLFDVPPAPADFASVDVWIDPARSSDDRDGCVAEALVAGVPVVASRTPLNDQRLERGLAGILVPPDDPNELAHAILAALFKPEKSAPKREHARATINRFDPSRRGPALTALYRKVVK